MLGIGTKFGCGGALCGACTAQVAEVEVSKDGVVRAQRVVCAVDCVVNPDTVRAQIQSAIIFGISAALHREITLMGGRVEQSNFHDYQVLRMNERRPSRFTS